MTAAVGASVGAAVGAAVRWRHASAVLATAAVQILRELKSEGGLIRVYNYSTALNAVPSAELRPES